MKIRVSVATTTYNHASFIAQAIDSVLMQDTNFACEQVIGEDRSTDGTRDVVLAYQNQYPDRIRVLAHEKNIGARSNFLQTLAACRGEYVALLEGDDYWTSPHKLQRQVDFLQGCPECSICFHKVDTRYEDGIEPPRKTRLLPTRAIYSLDDLLEHNFIPTCSALYRNGLFGEPPAWIGSTPTGDWPLHVLNAHYGYIGYIDEAMAVHRVHTGGIWSPKGTVERRKAILLTLEVFGQNLDPRYHQRLEDSIARWHLKLLYAELLAKDLDGMLKHLRDLVVRSRISKKSLARAAIWSLGSRTR